MNRTIRTAAFKAAVLAAAFFVSQVTAPPAFSQTSPPDLVEDFNADPRLDPLSSWSFVGPFAWGSVGKVMNTTSNRSKTTAFWTATGDEWTTGSLTARVKLSYGPTGYPPKAFIVFARNPTTGAYRWVSIASGSPGTVALGQTGVIGGITGRTFRSVRNTTIRKGSFYAVNVDIAPDGKVTVKVGTKTVIDAFPIPGTEPAASGQVGFIGAKSKISVDYFYVKKRRPNINVCSECHDGRSPNPDYPDAPDVYAYWDGTWWDTNRGGSSGQQQGGHGDPGGAVALDCTGVYGCHDMTTTAAGTDHLNGTLGGRNHTTANTFHLKPEFFTLFREGASGEYAVQFAVDNYCYLKCHSSLSPNPVQNHRHEQDSWGLDGRHGTADDVLTIPPRDVVALGTHLTASSVPLLMDSDLSTSAAGGANYAPCVSCHDPHGTGNPDTRAGTNRMTRMEFLSAGSPLCLACHI